MKEVSTKNAPQPAGHYAQGLISGGLIFVSGQLSIDPETGRPVHGNIEEQLNRALGNMLAVVEAAGSSKDQVLKCTVYISDIALWPKVNDVYAAFFGHHKPSRTVVPVSLLHHELLVEIDAIAATVA